MSRGHVAGAVGTPRRRSPALPNAHRPGNRRPDGRSDAMDPWEENLELNLRVTLGTASAETKKRQLEVK